MHIHPLKTSSFWLSLPGLFPSCLLFIPGRCESLMIVLWSPLRICNLHLFPPNVPVSSLRITGQQTVTNLGGTGSRVWVMCVHTRECKPGWTEKAECLRQWVEGLLESCDTEKYSPLSWLLYSTSFSLAPPHSGTITLEYISKWKALRFGMSDLIWSHFLSVTLFYFYFLKVKFFWASEVTCGPITSDMRRLALQQGIN